MNIVKKIVKKKRYYTNYRPFFHTSCDTLQFLFHRYINKKDFLLSYGEQKFFCRGIDTSALDGVFVTNEYAFIHKLFPKEHPKMIVDAGANIGLFALYVFNSFPESVVYSFEASKNTFSILEKSKNISDKIWFIEHAALCDNENGMNFVDAQYSMSGRLDFHGASNAYLVPSRTLVSIVNEIETNIDLLKCDIEGSEELFFKNSHNILSKIRHCIVELHPKYCDEHAVIAMLKDEYKYIYIIKPRSSSLNFVVCATNAYIKDAEIYGCTLK